MFFLNIQDEFSKAKKQNTSNTDSPVKLNDSEMTADYDEADESESQILKTHWSEMEVKKMKVDELRTELMARDMDTRGLKSKLIIRLQDALDAEKVMKNILTQNF